MNAAHKSPGIAIILNGPSACGKSTIQKEFQALMMPDLWIKIGIDNLFDNPMPEITPENMHYWQSQNSIRWVQTTKSESNDIITLHIGEQGENVIYGMNSAIACYVSQGCNVIVDYIAYKKEWFKDLRTKLTPFTTYYIGIDIPLDILEKREKSRGTSPAGHARSHYDTVHESIPYDFRVNTADNSPKIIVQKIKNIL